VIGLVHDWQGHSEEQLSAMKENLERIKAMGIEAIEE
jgi:rifampin ADP-ribosylating transferase